MAYTKGKLLTLEKGTQAFPANGKKYTVESTVSFMRWNMYQKLQIELGYGVTFEEMFNRLTTAYGLLNAQKFADAACEIRDIMKGVADVGKRDVPTVIKMCALFINTEDEDRRTITDAQITAKHVDWANEGYDVNSFFQLALHSIPNLVNIYKTVTQDTLEAIMAK